MYLVRFTQYNVTEQLYPKDIKPGGHAASKKRKLESPSVSTMSPIGGAASNAAIISQPAAINAELAEARRDKMANDESGKPVKKGRKLEQKKVLERGQKKWQDFAAKGVKGKTGKPKKIGETSMFRTPDNVHGRGMFAFSRALLSFALAMILTSGHSWLYRIRTTDAQGRCARQARLRARRRRRMNPPHQKHPS